MEVFCPQRMFTSTINASYIFTITVTIIFIASNTNRHQVAVDFDTVEFMTLMTLKWDRNIKLDREAKIPIFIQLGYDVIANF